MRAVRWRVVGLRPGGRPLPLAVCLALAAVAGCSMRIEPPHEPRDAVTAYIVDYGLHGSLLLPADEKSLVEFAYGQWDWFALGRDRWYNALGLALFPAAGTLGTRDHPMVDDAESLRRAVACEKVLTVPVERAAAERLRGRLSREYAEKQEQEVYNPALGMSFVPYRPVYWHGVRNCNTMLAAWLEELGCKVRGGRSFAVFEVVERGGRRAVKRARPG